jgi:hypothetical protein
MRLEGAQGIAEYIGWVDSQNRITSRFWKHLPDMKRSGAVLVENKGRPPRKHLWSLSQLVDRWLVAYGQEGKIF